jgi:hypothetical protein
MDAKVNDIGATNRVIAQYYYAAGFDDPIGAHRLRHDREVSGADEDALGATDVTEIMGCAAAAGLVRGAADPDTETVQEYICTHGDPRVIEGAAGLEAVDLIGDYDRRFRPMFCLAERKRAGITSGTEELLQLRLCSGCDGPFVLELLLGERRHIKVRGVKHLQEQVRRDHAGAADRFAEGPRTFSRLVEKVDDLADADAAGAEDAAPMALDAEIDVDVNRPVIGDCGRNPARKVGKVRIESSRAERGAGPALETARCRGYSRIGTGKPDHAIVVGRGRQSKPGLRRRCELQ